MININHSTFHINITPSQSSYFPHPVYEVWTHKNSLTAKELTSSGYQVGKEIIGTTAVSYTHLNMRKIELLVPASSLEVLKIAVIFGADAVYIGGEAVSYTHLDVYKRQV